MVMDTEFPDGVLAREEVFEHYLQMLHHPEAKVRAAAVGKLQNRHDPRTIDPLIRLLQTDADVEVRIQATYVLGSSEDPRALDVLIAAIHDPASGVRAEAAAVVRNFGDPRAVPPLIAALRDVDWETRMEAAF